MSVLQDVLTDLSAECENLPVEGVSGASYAHKVAVHLNTVLSTTSLCRFSTVCVSVSVSVSPTLAGHLSGCDLHL